MQFSDASSEIVSSASYQKSYQITLYPTSTNFIPSRTRTQLNALAPTALEHAMAFATSVALRARTHRSASVSAACARTAPTMLGRSGRRAPDFAGGWTPEGDTAYVEVRVLSVAIGSGDGGALLTLAPVGGRRAFKMAVTVAQADAVRAAARGLRSRSSGTRPATHELFKRTLDAAGALVTRAAITHVRAGVFIARVWVRAAHGETHHDARPSDAVALALRAGAPLFLNAALLAEWGVPVAVVLRDAAAGRCEALDPVDAATSASALAAASRAAPEHIALATLRAQLDLAVRLQRFRDAARLRDAIARICPAEPLERALRVAVAEQRFADAARIRDQIVLWRARLRRWERGGDEASLYGGAPDDIIDAAKRGSWDADPARGDVDGVDPADSSEGSGGLR